mmetsp:Transcript_65489/g.213192  ORF Transcript_65489/g.213192 Transcript_65489/m.213192 type:complete len:82 (-) Transcript_65489:26-271(-)
MSTTIPRRYQTRLSRPSKRSNWRQFEELEGSFYAATSDVRVNADACLIMRRHHDAYAAMGERLGLCMGSLDLHLVGNIAAQ